MKITLVAKGTGGWHASQIAEQAQLQNIEFNIVDVEDLNNLDETLAQFGDVIIWRAATLGITVPRTTLAGMLKDKHFINRSLFKYPFVAHKLFQQKYAQKYMPNYAIPTFHFRNKQALISGIETEKIQFPFIQKPDLGSKGIGVSLINSFDQLDNQDIKVKDFVYQNFIQNSGDFRVFVLGGRVIGAMKRVAQEGNFLNNISQGGTAYLVTDPQILGPISDIALNVASLFELSMCGVDVMYDTVNDKYHFLEVNTAPQWSGLQSQLDFNIGKEIVDYCVCLGNRKKGDLTSLVKSYYDNSFGMLGDKKFHYASRMYLWTKDDFYREKLDNARETYVTDDVDAKIQQILTRKKEDEDSELKSLSKKLREEHRENFPLLGKYNRLLFLTLFAETIYGQDIRSNIAKYVKDEEFITYRDKLLKDDRAMFILSTHAVNFFYLLQNHLGQEIVDPKIFLPIALKYDKDADRHKTLHFQIYLLTHCIIGESRFYAQKVQKNLPIYHDMLRHLEKLISESYFDISLDNKFEFLVCARLCDYQPTIANLIEQEAKKSLSQLGNYLIDTYNAKSSKQLGNKLPISEHRNVLYLMSQLDFRS